MFLQYWDPALEKKAQKWASECSMEEDSPANRAIAGKINNKLRGREHQKLLSVYTPHYYYFLYETQSLLLG